MVGPEPERKLHQILQAAGMRSPKSTSTPLASRLHHRSTLPAYYSRKSYLLGTIVRVSEPMKTESTCTQFSIFYFCTGWLLLLPKIFS
jgi:hypothetical protein